VDDIKTEEEQIAAIKNWWKENGNSLLMAVVAAIAIIFGWKAWQNNVEQTKAEASALYQQLMQGAARESKASNTEYLAGELKKNYGDSEYALFAALFLAKEAVGNSDYPKALEELDFVLENTEDTRTTHIVLGRKARILSQTGDNEDALNLLANPAPEFEAAFLEITGDIKLRQGDKDAARSVYEKAYGLVKAEPQRAPLLAVKLSSLGVDVTTL
jgi:predicted negative regulator of RcsB-dependent stress response